MIITLTGSNDYGLQKRLQLLEEQFVKKHGDLVLERIEADEVSSSQITDAVQALPFLAGKKMVVIKRLSANKSAADQIEQIISAVADSTDTVIYEPYLDKRTAYFKKLQKETRLEQYDELNTSQLAKWIVSEAKNLGGKIDSGNANFLVERVGAEQLRLASELQKLVAYEPSVTRESIELLTEQTPQSRIFELLDVAFSGNKQKALRLYQEQRAQKVEPQAVLAMLAWQLHLVVAVKSSHGKALTQLAKDLNTNIYPLSKAAKLAKKLSPERLQQLVKELFMIDLKTKTKNLELDEALKTYIVTI